MRGALAAQTSRAARTRGGVGVTGIGIMDERGIMDKGGSTDEGGFTNGGSVTNKGGIGDVARSTPTSESRRRPPARLRSNCVRM